MTHKILLISTLSPVHIGCGEVFEPTRFVIHEEQLHAFDIADLAQALTPDDRNEIQRRSDRNDAIGALQQYFRNNAERFLGIARRSVDVVPSIVKEYEQKAGKPAQRGSGGTAVYNLFPIERTAYNPIDDAPYLPGSSIKGSLRTAWLNRLNQVRPLTPDENADQKRCNARLQERLLGYTARTLERDPFRHVRLADSHPETDEAPPTRVLYAISKKKNPPRDGERRPNELKTFWETVPECMPAAFVGELRLSADRPGGPPVIRWNDLCAACNAFYRPQLEAELTHSVLGPQIDPAWSTLIRQLLVGELAELIDARQGFLLRVGRHSGAESVTLDGVRRIKILGRRVNNKPTHDFRPTTTEKRFASPTPSGDGHLLPFGWIWVDACDDAHRYLSDAVRARLAAYSQPLREAHKDRQVRNEARRQQQLAQRLEAEKERQRAAAEERARQDAKAARAAELARMTPRQRRIEEFKAAFAARAEQLRGGRERLNGDYHNRARKLAREALEGSDWTADEKRQAADAIAEWLPKVVEKIDKDQLKKLKLNALRS